MMLYFGIPYPNIKIVRYRVLGWNNPYREKNYRNDVNQLLEDMINGDIAEKITNDFSCQYIPWNPKSADENDYIDVLFDQRNIQPQVIQQRFEKAGLQLEPAKPFYRLLSFKNYLLIALLSPFFLAGEIIFFVIDRLFSNQKK